jgi:hypothetical protein
MQLSVLSALARMDVDPWEEAAHLATMPKALAERTLASAIDKVFTLDPHSPEAEAVAARLVQLLPRGDAGDRSTSTDAARAEVNYPMLCLVWLSLSIAISLSSPHRQRTTADPAVPLSKSTAASPLQSGNLLFEDR